MAIQFEYCFSNIGLYIYIDIYGYGMLSMGFDCCLEEISLLYWVSNCPGNMPKYYPGNMSKYYSTKYHYRNLHEVK